MSELKCQLAQVHSLEQRMKQMETFEFFCPFKQGVVLEPSKISDLLKGKLMEFCGVQLIQTIKNLSK